MRFCIALFIVLAVAPRIRADVPFTSCAWVRAENDASGAGFVIDEQNRWLVTCRHVVGDQVKVDVFFPWYRSGELVADKREYLGNRLRLRELGLLVTGKVIKKSDANDLALIELESLPPGTKAFPFAARPPQLGESLRVIGHRTDLDTLWNLSTGPLRTHGPLTDGYPWRAGKLAVNADVLIGQLPIEEGDSGGPVLNDRGELVGMACALRRRVPLAAVAISSEEIRKFLDLATPTAKVEPAAIADTLMRATVWIRPTATEFHLAGVLVEPNLILTAARGLGSADRVGVAFPLFENGKWIGERGPYRDAVGIHLKGNWRAGEVIARDASRDLALIRVDSIPSTARSVPLAVKVPQLGDAVHAMNHPGGLEFAWVYSAGAVRQRGRVKLADGDGTHPVPAHLFQLPTQAGSPGGPVLNERGELLGVLSAREGTQLVGYAATTDEIARFLDTAPLDRPARTLEGLLSRLETAPERLIKTTALLVDDDTAVSLDPGCGKARLNRSNLLSLGGPTEAAVRELDIAVEKGSFHRGVLMRRAEFAIFDTDFRKARGDLERILDPYPADGPARQRLVFALLGLGKDDEAAAAVADTVRADPKRIRGISRDLVTQADALSKKFPDSPSAAADWLAKALTALRKAPLDADKRADLETALTSAAMTKNEKERLAILHAFVKKLAAAK